MRIGVDADNVFYDFGESFLTWCGLEVRPPSSWEFYEDYGMTLEQYLERFAEGVDAGHIFRIGAPIPGSLEGMKVLKEMGHTIHIVTDRFVGKNSILNTAEWIKEYQPPFDTLTFSKDKTIVRTDMFVDDRPSHIDALNNIGTQAYLFYTGRSDQDKWIANYDGTVPVVYSWPEFVDKVIERVGSGF